MMGDHLHLREMEGWLVDSILHQDLSLDQNLVLRLVARRMVAMEAEDAGMRLQCWQERKLERRSTSS